MPDRPKNVTQLLRLEVPVVVRLGDRRLAVAEVLGLVPGAIIELNRPAESELDLFVNNVKIGCGNAVKVGENFGLQITYVGDMRQRVAALGGSSAGAEPEVSEETTDLNALAEALLAGQT